jgi:hypothetical protein
MNKYLKKYIDFDNYEKENSNFLVLKDCPQDFINFLKNKNIYEKFINNLLSFNNQQKKENWKQCKFCKDVDKFFYILSSFYWHETEEGSDFWEDINNKWRKLIGK